jgi:hypothetical protein
MAENKTEMPLVLQTMQLLCDAQQNPFDAESIVKICHLPYDYVVKELAANKEYFYKAVSLSDRPRDKYSGFISYIKEKYFEEKSRKMEWFDIMHKTASNSIRERFGFNNHTLSSSEIEILIDADVKSKDQLKNDLSVDIEENWHTLWKVNKVLSSAPNTIINTSYRPKSPYYD